jgi:hypothetical protein
MAQKKRSIEETQRTMFWYEKVEELLLCAGYLKKGNMAGRSLGKKIIELAKVKKIGKKTLLELGSPEAWRWYQTGSRTPSNQTRAAVDTLLSKLNQPPIGWVLLGRGEVRLEPVWLWPSSKADLKEIDIRLCAEFESKFWNRFPSADAFRIPELAAEFGVIKYMWDVEDEISWPPRLLLPAEVAQTLKKEPGAPFAHILDDLDHELINKPSNESEYPDQELYLRFKRWAYTPEAMYADGMEWYARLEMFPLSNYYIGDMLACIGVQILEKEASEKLSDEIRQHFKSFSASVDTTVDSEAE